MSTPMEPDLPSARRIAKPGKSCVRTTWAKTTRQTATARNPSSAGMRPCQSHGGSSASAAGGMDVLGITSSCGEERWRRSSAPEDTERPVIRSRTMGIMVSLSTRESVVCDLCGKDDVEPLVTKNGFRVVRCRGCSLIYLNPRLASGGLVDIYDSETFTHHQTNRADETAPRKEASARLARLEQRHPRRGSLLDVGCSVGIFLDVARSAGWSVAGIDVAQKSVATCKARGLDVRRATLEDDGFEPRTFDAVTMFDSIEHMPSPVSALRRVNDLLTDDGAVLITTPNVEGMFPRVTWQLFGRTFGGWDHPGPPGHVYQFGKKTLAKALEKTGFTVVHEETERIPLGYAASELADVIVDTLRGRNRRPGPQDARGDESTDTARAPEKAQAPPRSSILKRAVRGTARTAAWALAGAVSGPAPLLGSGDSLIVIARKR
jgi:2-polyprenyl-3-methyl-5-hydroxy-6-metoxy-1,4-benzoquinol methylase